MTNRSMFPYRRGTGKKRPRGSNRRNREGGGKRQANSPQELLSLMQPATKALAQVLVGNTRPSGQFVHARNILDQADQMVQDRAVDRMPPKLREDFLEQLARLKLTVSDAAELEDESEAENEDEAIDVSEKKEVGPEQLRELALRLAGGTTSARQDGRSAQAPSAEEIAGEADEAEKDQQEELEQAKKSPVRRQARSPQTGVRASKLRLNVPRDDVSAADA